MAGRAGRESGGSLLQLGPQRREAKAMSGKVHLWKVAAFPRAAHSFLDTYGTAMRDVIVEIFSRTAPFSVSSTGRSST